MLLAVLMLWATSASSQVISIGVKGGLPLGDALEGRTIDAQGILGQCGECASGRTLPYLVGPSLEVYLTHSFTVSVDALYGRADYTHISTTFSTPTFVSSNTEKHAVDHLEIPILLQYKFRSWHAIRPFVAGGASVRYVQDALLWRRYGLSNPSSALLSPREAVSLSVPRVSTDWGPAISVGARFGTGRFHPSIEYRYTHWNDQPIAVTPLDVGFQPLAGSVALRSTRNQSELIAGLMMDVTAADADAGSRQQNRTGFGKVWSRFTAGVKVGLPLMQAFEVAPAGAFAHNPYFDKCSECASQRTVPYMIGPAVEISIVGPYSVSAEALYSRADFNHTSSTFSVSGSSFLDDRKKTVDRWEFPLMLKLSIGGWHAIHPFIAVGGSAQYNREKTVQWLSGSHCPCSGTLLVNSNVASPSISAAVFGPTVSAGARIGRRRLGPTVEFRYTRWFDAALTEASFNSTPSVDNLATVRSNQNQAQLLVSLMF